MFIFPSIFGTRNENMLVWFISLSILLLAVGLVLFSSYENKEQLSELDIPLLIWWTPFTGEFEKVKKCSLGSCLVTENRSLTNVNHAYLFYGSFFAVDDLPLPRNENSWWALLHEESPKNQPLFNHEEVISLFNVSSTFKAASHMPLTLLYLKDEDCLKSPRYFIPVEEKNEYLTKISPIIYLQSDCNPPSERDNFVKELSKYIKIDSYGKCLNTHQLPENLIGIENMNDKSILKLIAKYKFSLAIENYACNDYITEKLWRPLSVGSIPLYWGAPNIEKWIPNPESIINIRQYSTPYELFLYIDKLLKNETSYERHLAHKVYSKIKNKNLLNMLLQRDWGVGEDQLIKETFVEKFECFVCDKIIENKSKPLTLMATNEHYGCPLPQTVINGKSNPTSAWVDAWLISQAEARVVRNLVSDRSSVYNKKRHTEKLLGLLNEINYFDRIN